MNTKPSKLITAAIVLFGNQDFKTTSRRPHAVMRKRSVVLALRCFTIGSFPDIRRWVGQSTHSGVIQQVQKALASRRCRLIAGTIAAMAGVDREAIPAVDDIEGWRRLSLRPAADGRRTQWLTRAGLEVGR